MVWLGLTGGIGSGKSTVAQMLHDLSAQVIDVDAISRQLTAPGGAAMDGIRRAFGADYVGTDGAMLRDRMRERIVGDAAAKQLLQSIVHPLVAQETARQADRAHSPLLVFDIPLLVESAHWRARLDHVLVVDCLVATQVERVCARNGLAATAVQGLISLQASREQRLAAADSVLFNEGLSLHELRAQTHRLASAFGL